MWTQAGGDDMRLSSLERRALAHATHDLAYRVEIFGSRIDDAARGGDIDLIVFAPDLAAEDRLRLSLRIAVAFRSICDEKIDVHVIDPHDLTATERAFLGVIRSEPLDLSRLVGA
jgi:predicted nucleotidyltransferase